MDGQYQLIFHFLLKPTAKYALSIWASDADQTYLEDLPAGSVLNPLVSGETSSFGNMVYAQVSSWTDPQGITRFVVGGGYGYVHTKFQSTSPSSYYIDL